MIHCCLLKPNFKAIQSQFCLWWTESKRIKLKNNFQLSIIFAIKCKLSQTQNKLAKTCLMSCICSLFVQIRQLWGACFLFITNKKWPNLGRLQLLLFILKKFFNAFWFALVLCRSLNSGIVTTPENIVLWKTCWQAFTLTTLSHLCSSVCLLSNFSKYEMLLVLVQVWNASAVSESLCV